jgi:hypothetical protein
MMGICSLFVLSRGLSLLAEVVRMLNDGKEGKASEAVARPSLAGWVALRRSGGSMPPSDGSGAGVVGFDQRYMAQSA